MGIATERYVKFAVGVVSYHARICRFVDVIVEGSVRIVLFLCSVELGAEVLVHSLVLIFYALVGMQLFECIELIAILGIEFFDFV